MASPAPIDSAPRDASPPTPLQLFLAFAKIGLTSFGGGLSGWMMREFVQRRAWLSEGEFLSGLALAQAFPGVNVVNLAIWIGFRLRGGAGALVSALGLTVPAMMVAVAVLVGFSAAASRITCTWRWPAWRPRRSACLCKWGCAPRGGRRRAWRRSRSWS